MADSVEDKVAKDEDEILDGQTVLAEYFLRPLQVIFEVQIECFVVFPLDVVRKNNELNECVRNYPQGVKS